MEIQLISLPKDQFPACGFFIEGADLELWLTTLNAMNLDPTGLEMYALPSSEANVVWGCIVLMNAAQLPKELGRLTTAHHISNKLIIPEKTTILPELTTYDLETLFGGERFVYHMDFGLVKLEEPLSLGDYVRIQDSGTQHTMKPIPFAAIDPQIQSFRVEATPLEEIQAELEANLTRETLKNKPLNFGEKARLKLYQQFLNIKEGPDGTVNIEETTVSALDKLSKLLGLDGPDVTDKVMEDYKNLMDRNKKEVERLMDMLENNPEEALRYAIPLDEHGYSRGEQEMEFKMQDRGSDFSLFGRLTGGGGGGNVNLGDEYFKLQQQYRRSAEALEKKGDFEKAAFIYLKLLKDYAGAAETLRRGKRYEKAAYVYTKYLKNELLAAECFEEGLIYDKAIELYRKHNKLEKVGDLYTVQGKQMLANKAYQEVIDDYLQQSQHIKAALLCKKKLSDLLQTQQILLDGWKSSGDAYSCLCMYFSNIPEADEAWDQLTYIQSHHVTHKNDVTFLQVLKNEYTVRYTNKLKIRELGYTLISQLLERNAISSTELLAFNDKDKRLSADTMRYNINQSKRMTD